MNKQPVPTGRRWLHEVAASAGVPHKRLGRFAQFVKASSEGKYRRDRCRMFAESLGGLQFQAVREAKRIADIGSGYGYPGLVLACALPEVDVHLVEPDPERADWLQRAVEFVGLPRVTVHPVEVERWDGHGFDVVTCKNVARLNTVVEWAAPLVRVGGTAVFWMNRLEPDERHDAVAAARQLGLRLTGKCHAHGWSRDARLLVTMEKIRVTPPEFPREPKMAWKRPLCADAQKDPHPRRTRV